MAITDRAGDGLVATLRELARIEHRPIGQVIEAAVAQCKREQFWQDVEASVDRLRVGPVAWKVAEGAVEELSLGGRFGLRFRYPPRHVDAGHKVEPENGHLGMISGHGAIPGVRPRILSTT